MQGEAAISKACITWPSSTTLANVIMSHCVESLQPPDGYFLLSDDLQAFDPTALKDSSIFPSQTGVQLAKL